MSRACAEFYVTAADAPGASAAQELRKYSVARLLEFARTGCEVPQLRVGVGGVLLEHLILEFFDGGSDVESRVEASVLRLDFLDRRHLQCPATSA